ncbi:hypothetical protein ABEG18_06125 [Alsobacter sp. KACC 23698]|uniref:Uncharacterized protein n=1 Tax=Alsobacter sp. KACC 23698 TaxID=3149229 RepID=A0AAU7JJ58_9HYPH
MNRNLIRSEVLRQFRLHDCRVELDEAALDALMRAVRIALLRPSPEMLKAGWGHHLNLESELGREFAADDYDRVIAALFDAPAPSVAETVRTRPARLTRRVTGAPTRRQGSAE